MNTKALVVAGAALAALNFTVAAEAADFNNYGQPPYVVVTNWSGFYGGVSLGYADASAEVSVSQPLLGEIGVTGSGGNFTAGLIAGFNWQYGNQVFGIEGDIALPTDFDYLASIRGRYGWIANNWLFYGTAGAAFIGTGGSASGFGFHFDGYNAPGFVIGGGAETKINSHLSAGLEGLYYIFAEDSQDIGFGFTVKVREDVFAVRGRLTYQFNGPSAGLW
jgi:outer membrane immunogenic protein